MSALSSTSAHLTPSWVHALRRFGGGVALLGVFLLWLWALPALVSHDGFVVSNGGPCAQASYRDPLTGQSRPAPHLRGAAMAACRGPARIGLP